MDYNDWLNGCLEHLVSLNTLAHEQFSLGNHERWDVSQETGQLVFSDAGKVTVLADVAFIGTYSFTSGTWRWGWANESILPHLTEDIRRVKQLGQEQGLSDLTDAQWECEEQDAWAMAAVALKLLEGQAVYRGPSDHSLTFLLLRNLRMA